MGTVFPFTFPAVFGATDLTSTDTVGLTDSVSKNLGRTVTDTVGVTDSVTFRQDFARTFTDAVTPTDTATTFSEAFTRTVTDPVGVTDSAAFVPGFDKTFTDTVGVTDALTVRRDLVQAFTDTVGVTDSLSFGANWVQIITESIVVVDPASAIITLGTPTGTNFNASSINLIGVTDSATFDIPVAPPPPPRPPITTIERIPFQWNGDGVFHDFEFTRNLGAAFQDQLIAAFQAPIPSQDPVSAYRYLNGRNKVLLDGTRAKPLIRMQDKNYSQLATIGQEMSCRFEEVATDSGEAGVVIRGGDYLGDFVRKAVRIEEDLHLSIDPIGTAPDWKTRWGGKITTIDVKRDSSGIHTVELIATSNREHLKTTLVGSTPFFPPEVQPIRMWMLPANIRTACAITFFVNTARLFFPPLSVATNLFNPFGWINPFGPDAILNLDPLSWPLQTQFVNFLTDQSRTSLLTGAWSNFHDATIDPLKDAGCCARVYTWFTDDVTGPHPELELLVGKNAANLARPHRNCLVAAFEDHSGHEGPTGTLLDGPINFIAKTLDDLITSTVSPVDENQDGEPDPLFQKIFGTAPKKPWAIYRDGQHSGIIESGYHQHKGPTKTTMTGGRSPKIVNDLQTFGIKYALSQISDNIQVPDGLGLTGIENIGSPGLEELYQGQLDNMLFAFERYTNPFRALQTGDMAYQEWFEHPGSSAYTISGILNLRLGDFKKRAYRAFKTSIRNGLPYIINYDILLYDRVGFEQDGILYVDQVSAIKYEYDRSKPITYTVSVGDTAKDIDPFGQGIKALQALYTIASMAVGEGWLFD